MIGVWVGFGVFGWMFEMYQCGNSFFQVGGGKQGLVCIVFVGFQFMDEKIQLGFQGFLCLFGLCGKLFVVGVMIVVLLECVEGGVIVVDCCQIEVVFLYFVFGCCCCLIGGEIVFFYQIIVSGGGCFVVFFGVDDNVVWYRFGCDGFCLGVV